MTNQSGRVVRGYELRKLLGAGGFGEVYMAHQAVIERDVAIKVILPEYANHPDFVRNFEAEAQLVARLEHPHIIPLYDYWREPGGAFLVMRYVSGGSLRVLLQQKGALPPEAVARYLDQVAAALTIAHRAGVVHRDIKPDNILLDADDNTYLADFGIAKNLARIDGDDEGTLVGSPAYFAPEQIKAEAVSPQTDLYALGIVLFELLTGKPPFEGDFTSTQLIYSHLNEKLPSVTREMPHLSGDLDGVLQKATAKSPSERYPDARTLAHAFRDVIFKQGSEGETLVLMDPLHPDDLLLGEDEHIDMATGELVISILIPEVPNPYKGLRPFNEADAADFFGRNSLIEQLLKRMRPDQTLSRFLAVVGPSGSGKSSVVKAGLIPALRRGELPGSDRWFFTDMTPGDHPLRELAAAILNVAIMNDEISTLIERFETSDQGLNQAIQELIPGRDQIVLLVDQFEEAFTQSERDSEGMRFLSNLAAAVTAPDSRLRVIVTLRADFYDRPLLHPAFGGLMRERTEVVLPLSPEELSLAILGPARRAGLKLETGLVETIVSEVGDQPGALPLLQYALTELYERRKKNTLTLAAYRESGGVLGALARRAEELFSELEPDQQQAAQQIFLRLVTLGEGTEDTRRRARQTEFSGAGGNPTIQAVLDRYVKYRLLTFDRDPETRIPTIEVAHEALIRTWKRLREWLDTNREAIRTQRRLTAAEQEWINAGREESFLAEGARLVQFESLLSDPNIVLSVDEGLYVRYSIQARERKMQEERERQEREIALAKQAAESAQQAAESAKEAASSQQKAANRLKIVVGVMAVAAVITTLLGVFALDSRNKAVESEAAAVNNAATAIIAQNEALNNAATATIAQGEAIFSAATARANADIAFNNAATATIAQGEAINNAGTAAANANIAFNNAATATIAQGEAINNAGTAAANANIAFNNAATATIAQGEAINNAATATIAQGEALYSAATSRANAEIAFNNAATATIAQGEAINNAATARANAEIALNNAATATIAQGEAINNAATAAANAEIALNNAATATIAQGEAINNAATATIAQGEAINSASTARANEIIALNSAATATIAQGKAVAAEATAQANFDLTEGLRMAAAAKTVSLTGVTPELVAMLALRSLNIKSTQEGLDALDLALNLRYPAAYVQNHTAPISRLELSADGALLVSADSSGMILITDTADAQPIMSWEHPGGEVTSLALSRDAKRLLIGDADGNISLWQVNSGDFIEQYEVQRDRVTGLKWLSDGERFVSANNDGTIALWQTGQEDPLESSVLAGGFSTLDLAPDQDLLLLPSLSGKIYLWSLESWQQAGEIAGSTGGTYDARFVKWHDVLMILAAGADRTIRLIDIQSGEALLSLEGHTGTIYALDVDQENGVIVSGSEDKSVRLWDLDTLRPLRVYRTHQSGVTAVRLNPTNQTIISGALDTEVLFWQTQDEQSHLLLGHRASVLRAEYSRDGRYILTSGAGDNDGSNILWDAATGRMLVLFETGAYSAFSPDGRDIAVALLEDDNTVKIINIESGRVLREFAFNDGFEQPRDMHFSADGRQLLVLFENSLVIWNTTNGALIREIALDAAYADHLRLFPDGQKLALIQSTGLIVVYDLSTGEQIKQLSAGENNAFNTVEFTSDGRLMVGADTTGAILFWDYTADYKEVRRLVDNWGMVYSIVFSPDGQLMFTAGSSATAQMWRLQQGQVIRQFGGHEGSINTVALSPDGRFLLTAGEDKTTRIWWIDFQRARDLLCTRIEAYGDFSTEQLRQYRIPEGESTCPPIRREGDGGGVALPDAPPVPSARPPRQGTPPAGGQPGNPLIGTPPAGGQPGNPPIGTPPPTIMPPPTIPPPPPPPRRP